MPSQPTIGIQVLFVTDLQGRIAKELPDGGGQSEDVGSPRRHPTEMAFGGHETSANLTRIEVRTRLCTGTEPDELDSPPGLTQDVPRLDPAVHDVAFMGMRQTVGGGHRRIENGREIGFSQFAEIRSIHETSHHGEFGRAQAIPAAVNAEGRANGGVRQAGQDLVLPENAIKGPVRRSSAGVLEHHQITSLGMGGQEDTSIRILPESGKDPESMLDVAGSKIRLPRPTHARSHRCHVVLHLDPDTTVEMPPKLKLQIENDVRQPRRGGRLLLWEESCGL